MQSNKIRPNISQRLTKWTAISSLALIAVTWRLWTPQAVFPQVPVFENLCSAPPWFDWVGLSGTFVGLILLLISRPRAVQIGCALLIVSLLLLFSLDQHRFQPWAYELWLFCVVGFACRDSLRLNLLRWLLISVYFYSAIGKLDFEFLHTVGQQMLTVVVQGLGLAMEDFSLSLRLGLVALFPLVELATAVALAFPKTRKIASWMAIGLHLGLIVILGPFGLNHRPAVLIWNLQVGLQVYWLFVSKHTSEPEKSSLSWPERVASAMIGAAIIMPSTERFGIWDHWPSWALYAPHSSRVHVEISGPAIHQIPDGLRQLVREAPLESDEIAIWQTLPIDRWSLETLDTPIYPQARFQLGVAEKIASSVDAGIQVRVTVLGPASRYSGSRNRAVYTGASQLNTATKRYWVNSHPRKTY